MKIDVDAFKKELCNYSYYKLNLEGTERLIEYNEYLLSNVKGVDPSHIAASSGKVWVETEEFKRLSNELEKLYKRKRLRLAQIEYIESVLAELNEETRQACIDIYVKGETYAKTSSKHYLSKKGLFSRIEKELNKKL